MNNLPSNSAIQLAKRASILIPSYSGDLSNPFSAIERQKADCIGGVLVIQALRLADDPEFRTIKHSARYTDAQTGLVTPWEHYLAINNLGDVVDMFSGVEARNRRIYAEQQAQDRDSVDKIDDFIVKAMSLTSASPITETETKSRDLRFTEIHRLALIDTDMLLEQVAPGSSMGDLRDSAFEAFGARGFVMV
jgi:hypothetical protein